MDTLTSPHILAYSNDKFKYRTFRKTDIKNWFDSKQGQNSLDKIIA